MIEPIRSMRGDHKDMDKETLKRVMQGADLLQDSLNTYLKGFEKVLYGAELEMLGQSIAVSFLNHTTRNTINNLLLNKVSDVEDIHNLLDKICFAVRDSGLMALKVVQEIGENHGKAEHSHPVNSPAK